MARPRKPTQLKVLAGTDKPSRANDREPIPAPHVMIRPKRITYRARRIWDRIMRDYGATGILTSVDTETFRAYCDACARYELYSELLDKATPTVHTQRGEVKNPLHQIVRDNATLMLRLARELGFTPSARASLKTPDGGDELDQWTRDG
jgi:P27 family predicted phage terminase small subunit